MPERELRVEIARVGGLLYQLERAILVVFDAVAADIAYAEREYAGDVTELGALRIVGRGARKIDRHAVARKIFFAYIEVFFAEEIGGRERFVFIVVSHYFTLCEVYCSIIIPRAQTIIKLLTALFAERAQRIYKKPPRRERREGATGHLVNLSSTSLLTACISIILSSGPTSLGAERR